MAMGRLMGSHARWQGSRRERKQPDSKARITKPVPLCTWPDFYISWLSSSGHLLLLLTSSIVFRSERLALLFSRQRGPHGSGGGSERGPRWSFRRGFPGWFGGQFAERIPDVQRQAANRADRHQRKKQSEDQMQDLENPVNHRDGKAEQELADRLQRSRGGIRNHVKGEQNERRAGHRHERHVQRGPEYFGPHHALEHKAQHPRARQQEPPGEQRVDDDPRDQDHSGHHPVPGARDVFREMVRRRETNLRK